jgi:hypothetical protein
MAAKKTKRKRFEGGGASKLKSTYMLGLLKGEKFH